MTQLVHLTQKYLTFKTKLILYFLVLIVVSTSILGLTAYLIAQSELNKKGRQVLDNAVIQAMDVIRAKYTMVSMGAIDKDVAQEEIKEILIGPRNPDGTRTLHHNIDLGENGYFIIYDSKGFEIGHPIIEGQNVWNVTSLDDSQRFLVQEQIQSAMNGDTFLTYTWWLPGSNTPADKISCSRYFEEWDWIVVSTAYALDFNQGANKILFIIVLTLAIILSLAALLIIRYVNQVTAPIVRVSEGMTAVSENVFELLDTVQPNDEISRLVNGYNHMVQSLNNANRDISEKSEFISYLAYHDNLTGLPNRHGIANHITQRLSEGCITSYMAQVSIIGLKLINSALGYEQGDNMLKTLGTYFLDIRTEHMDIARTSSNEFTLWIEDVPAEDIEPFLEKLRLAAIEHINTCGFGRLIDFHIALVMFPEHGKNFSELYEKTLIAMKYAKDQNILLPVRYHSDIRLQLENEVSMRRYLIQALDKKEIVAHYQTQVDWSTNVIVGVEALARWNSESLGNVSPIVFIPAINQLNLVDEFSSYMIDQVLFDYPALKKKYNDDITVSINISPLYFMDKSFLEELNIKIKEYNIPPEKLTLEITEDIFISDFENITEKINDLHRIGVRVSIDDFGTGYSSLNYLTRMKFDEMKIDKSFINKILEEPKSFKLLEILCNIAEVYGYDIVAEGVETQEQLEKISTTPLRIIQGYLFSKPEPLE